MSLTVSKKTGFTLIVVLLFILFLEGISNLVFRYLASARPSLVHTPPPSGLQAEYESYLLRRDPVLGWPYPEQFGSKLWDESGARPLPAYPEPGGACVSVFGDSFAYAEEVRDEDAWANLLAIELECRVANYGVRAYGVDQAYLRFKAIDQAGEGPVVLVIYPDDFMRNVNQLRRFITGASSYFRFKPRFVIDEQQRMQVIPLPQFPPIEIDRVFELPQQYLPHDYFVRGGEFSQLTMRWPRCLSLVELFLNPRFIHSISNYSQGLPYWFQFVQFGHPSASAEVTAAIVEAFSKDVTARQRAFAVVLLPTPRMFTYFEATGSWPQAEFSDFLKGQDIAYLDLGVALAASGESVGYCEFLTDPENCYGHFNAKGNRMLAAFVRELLRDLME